jgi:hypothetical protein
MKMKREAVVAYCRYYTGILLYRLQKITINFSQYSLYPGQHSKLISLKYNTSVINSTFKVLNISEVFKSA